MAVFPIASSLVVLLSLIILCICHVLPTGGSTALSFSVKLIHRDNPESPIYDSTSTPLSRIRAAIQRSIVLANYFHNTSASANSNSRHLTAIDDVSFFLDGMGYQGTFLVELGIGEPQQPAHFGISTEEGMSFVMCKPCENCDEKDAPFFDPNASTSYSTVPCLSDSCKSIRRFPCDSTKNRICKYEERPHGRYFIISGILSSETVHLQNTAGRVSVQGILFGCTHKIKTRLNDGTLDNNRIGIGIIGLNNHRLSFLRQLGYATHGKLPRKFSYCLSLKKEKVTRMHFGDTPPFGEGSHTTPLFVSQFGHRYYLQLKKIACYFDGETAVHISANQKKGTKNSDRGNMLMDSSSPITYIKREEFKKLKKFIVDGMDRDILRVQVPEGLDEAIELCYNWHIPVPQKLPFIKFEFQNGAIMSTRNLFSVVVKDVICLLLASARLTEGVRVLGIGPQIGHRIGIDLEKNEVNINNDNCESG